jgi:hypothetical protein
MIPVSAVEQLELMDLVSRGIDQQAPELAKQAEDLAGTGIDLPAGRRETAEIYSVGDDPQSITLYLNDAALRLYQGLGGSKAVSGMAAEVPGRPPEGGFSPSRILSAVVYTRI